MKRDVNSKIGISDDVSPSRERPGRWARWRSRRVLRWVLGVILGLLVLYVIWFAAATVMLDRAKARVAKAGDSLRLADYMPPEPPPGENATPYLDAGDAIMRGRKGEHDSIRLYPRGEFKSLSDRLQSVLALGEKASVEDIDFLRGQLEEFDLVLRITDEAMPRKQAWFDTEYESRAAFAVDIPSYQHRRFLAYVLEARVLVAAHEGRFDDASEDAARMFRLANWAYQETPFLLSAMVGIAIANEACDTVQAVFNLGPLSKQGRGGILEEVGGLSAGEAIPTALRVERASIYDTLTDVSFGDEFFTHDSGGTSLGFVVLSVPLRAYLMMDTAATLNAMGRLIEQADRPAYEQPRDYPAADMDFPWWSHFTMLVIPNYTAVSAHGDRALAKLDLMTIAFELEEYREEEGGYPDSLDALGGERLIDPFSGESYRYRRTGDGYVLWSISANRRDDGGEKHGETADWKAEGDIVWKVER